MTDNVLHITKCDNELIFLAFQGSASFEIANIKSGNNNPVDVTLNLTSGIWQDGFSANGVNSALSIKADVPLNPGEYELIAMGINWGGPADFNFTFNGKDHKSAPTGNGLVWKTDPIKFTIPKA